MKIMRMLVVLVAMAVMGCGGSGGNNKTPEPVPIPTPASAEISGLSSTTITRGGPAFTLTVHGENFSASSVVKIDGVIRNVTIDGSTKIVIPMSASDIATPGKKTISVDAATAVLTVKEQPWMTAENWPAQRQVMTNQGLLTAYAKGGDVFLCLFDANGERVAIGEYSDVHITVDSRKESARGLAVFGGYAYVAVFREFPDAGGFGEGLIVKVNLASGGVREAIIMQWGDMTGFAADAAGTIYVAFNFTGQLGEYKSAVVGINAADAAVVFEQGWTNSPRITAVAVDGESIYMGGTVTNAAGTQARMYARKECRTTKALLWESQIGTIASSPNDDTMYSGSFVLDAANDALYFSGALGYLTDTPRGVIARIKTSSADGDFVWALSVPNTMAYAFAPMTVDEAGGLYGYNYQADSVVRMDQMAPSNRPWSMTHALQPNCITAIGDVVYVPYPSGKIIRLMKVGGSVIN